MNCGRLVKNERVPKDPDAPAFCNDACEQDYNGDERHCLQCLAVLPKRGPGGVLDFYCNDVCYARWCVTKGYKAPTHLMASPCQHRRLISRAEGAIVEEGGESAFYLAVDVRCADCDEQFVFIPDDDPMPLPEAVREKALLPIAPASRFQ